MDIQENKGAANHRGSKVVAYGAVVFGGELAYAGIDSQWSADETYVVLYTGLPLTQP